MLNSSPLPSAESEWAAFAAIDWADQKHFWRLVPTGSDQQEQGELENTPEAVETWAVALQERFGGRPIALCLEQSRGNFGLYARQIRTPGHFPRSLHDGGSLSSYILPFGREG